MVSGQSCRKTQGAVAVDVLPSDALHFLGHGAVDGAEGALIGRLRETNRGRGWETRSKTCLQVATQHNLSLSYSLQPSMSCSGKQNVLKQLLSVSEKSQNIISLLVSFFLISWNRFGPLKTFGKLQFELHVQDHWDQLENGARRQIDRYSRLELLLLLIHQKHFWLTFLHVFLIYQNYENLFTESLNSIHTSTALRSNRFKHLVALTGCTACFHGLR